MDLLAGISYPPNLLLRLDPTPACSTRPMVSGWGSSAPPSALRSFRRLGLFSKICTTALLSDQLNRSSIFGIVQLRFIKSLKSETALCLIAIPFNRRFPLVSP
ncbi:hypothetical protein O181_010427 [Austropuccinia psidii MF-1]|uniref:Uncharacterized protein n=1 Tax=Austropuccinia psidii MF-1 TaxID=1389203 RepID=A0A9Q3GL71_9BASI|nr:hypothetical protein [Austropuccinia psidii MF-1]